MGMSWYYTRAGEQQGPIEFAGLQQMAGAGTLHPQDLVWNEEMPQWIDAASISALFAAAPQAMGTAPAGTAVTPLAYYAAPVGQYVYAGFWLRFVASLVDGLLLLVILFGISAVARIAFSSGRTGSGTAGNGDAILALVLNLINIVVIWLYFAMQESGPKQATPGKSMLGLQVTDMNGQRISFGRATGRFFGKYVSELILFIGFIMAGLTQRKQAFHDMMAGCLVIKSGTLKVV